MQKLVKESLSFERGKSPKDSMGVGMINQIEEWVKNKSQFQLPKGLWLSLCAEFGKLEWVNFLYNLGDPYDDIHINGEYPLKWAVLNNHIEIAEFLIEKGFDPVFGARPLKRTIQRFLEDPLAGEIISKRFKEGSMVKVVCKNQELVFE